MNSPQEMGNGPVIHDHRRIDPVTGQVREPGRPRGKHAASGPGGYARDEEASATGGSQPGMGAEPEGSAPAPGPDGHAEQDRPVTQAGDGSTAHTAPPAGTGVNEEMATLKEQLADRTAVRELALANVLTELLPALDAIGQARQHDELSGGFKSVAESLESAASKLGLVTYGEPGEPFDPKIHEALAHSFSPDVAEVSCAEIFQPGYKVGDRILRPARVLVAEPATGPDGAPEPGAQPDNRDDE